MIQGRTTEGTAKIRGIELPVARSFRPPSQSSMTINRFLFILHIESLFF